MSSVTVYTSTLTGQRQEFEAGQRQKPWPHSSDDPTATKSLRSKFAAEYYRRFRALKGAIREGIVNRGVLGEITPGPGAGRPTSFTGYQGIDIRPPDPGQFDFPSDERKVEEFMEWLETQVDRGILESGRQGRRVAAHEHWQNVYLRSAYEKGVTHADAALYDMGVITEHEMVDDVFRSAMHADAVGLIYTRSYRELEGITQDMSRQISRELADGISQGENPLKIASRINDRVDKVGLHRARMLSRTEVNRAHNEASLNRYGDVSERLDGVTALVEFTTAGDARVCPECSSLESMTVDESNARGILPVHPSCRCSWIPVPEGTDPTRR